MVVGTFTVAIRLAEDSCSNDLPSILEGQIASLSDLIGIRWFGMFPATRYSLCLEEDWL